jgi:DNA-binding NarL/FixJ family response regulator
MAYSDPPDQARWVPRRVLIVDDDPSFQIGAARLLADRGYVIVGSAATLAEARTAYGQTEPDALLVDVHLPDGSGMTLAEELRRAPSAPRVLLTSSDSDAVRRRLIEQCGAAGFVAKEDLAASDLALYLGSPRDDRAADERRPAK